MQDLQSSWQCAGGSLGVSCELLAAACGSSFLTRGLTLHWERGVLATGLPAKSQEVYLQQTFLMPVIVTIPICEVLIVFKILFRCSNSFDPRRNLYGKCVSCYSDKEQKHRELNNLLET